MNRRDYLHPSLLTGDAFWAFARAMLRYPWHVAGTLVLVAFSAVTMGTGIVGAKPVLDALLKPGGGKDLVGLAADWNARVTHDALIPDWLALPQAWVAKLPAGDSFTALAWILGVLAALTVVGAFATFGHSYLSLTVVNRVVAMTRRRAYRAMLHAPLRTVVQRGPSDAVSRIINDSSRLHDGLNVLLSKTTLAAAKGAAAFLAAMLCNWKVTLAALLVAPVLYTIIRKLGKRIRRASGAALESQGALSGVALEALQGLRVVKAHDAETYESGRFHQINKRVLRELNRVRTARAIASPLTETLALVVLCALTLAAGRAIIRHGMDPASFILAIIALAAAGAAMKPLTALAHDIQTSTPAAERLRELIATPEEPGREKTLTALPRHAQSIEFRGVGVTYAGRTAPALKGISLHIPHGQKVAFVGGNGSGKTTLLSLINRMFDPDEGAVLIDGQDVRGVRVRGLRAQVGVVTQETVLFRASVRDNIAYGSWAKDGAIEEAAKQARAHEFISRLPKGYATMVAEQGLSLSGGQRQRIAIARAILRNPSILLLDEATSMIDSESEAAITHALEEFSRGRTTLVVAHRLSTVINADRIVVLDAGQIVDSGTHAELLGRCSVYQQLIRHQFPQQAV